MNQLLHSIVFGKGTPLIILHGFLGMGNNWRTLGKQIAQQGFQVHLLDLRNHGRSFHAEDFSYELLAEDLTYYLASHQLEKVVLLGHSMGGKAAMFFASTHPDSVKQLIVVDVAPKYYPRHHQMILKGLAALKSTHLKSRIQADEILSSFVDEKTLRQFLLKNLIRHENGQLVLCVNLQSLNEHIDEIGKALPSHYTYKGETLFIKGEKSNYISSDDELHILKHFPHSRIQSVSNAGHWTHADNPVAFIEAVIGFMKSKQLTLVALGSEESLLE